VAGIQSPGLTASPAIAEYVKDILKSSGLELKEKSRYETDVPELKTIRNARSAKEIDALVAENPAYAKIICRCEKISEAEIVFAIRKGHTTLDGIKFYTRSGMGRCQGGFCSYKILKIIERETGIPVEKITKRGGGSEIVTGRLGE
jgi:glycerol-3-phosphate dehydrogenase